jgi:hypothetical protein
MKATGRVAFETPAGVWAYFKRASSLVQASVYVRPPVKIAVKRPAYGCLRCFRLSEGEMCEECYGRCEEILAEPNSVLPKET